MDNDKNVVKKETGLGTIRVADEVVSIIAGLATTEVGVGWEQDFRKGDLCRRDVVTCRDVQVLGGLFKVRCHALTELVLQSELPIGRRKSLFGGKLVELV